MMDSRFRVRRKKQARLASRRRRKNLTYRARENQRQRSRRRQKFKSAKARMERNRRDRIWQHKRLRNPKHRATRNKKVRAYRNDPKNVNRIRKQSRTRARRRRRDPKVRAQLNKERRQWGKRQENKNRISQRNHASALKLEYRYKKLLYRVKQLRQKSVRGHALTFKQYKRKICMADGTQKLCIYCLGEISKRGGGLDRKDSNVNYTHKNTVPCCRGCNVWKHQDKSYTETMIYFKPMREAVKKRNIE